jgi:hypothetical protein
MAFLWLSHYRSANYLGSPIKILAVLPSPPKTFSMSPEDKLLMRDAKAK